MQDRETAMTGSRPNRRELISKALKLGSAAYVVPVILSSATPAMAQVTNPACVGASCGTFIACNNNVNCGCVTLASGGGFCFLPAFLCAGYAQCGAGNTCPPGFVCAVNTCCGVPICVALAEACPAAGVASPAAPASGTPLRR